MFYKMFAFMVLAVIAFAEDKKLDNFLKKGDYDKVLSYIEQQIPADQRDETVLNQMAYASEKLGMTEKAIACYSMALKMNPESSNALSGLKNAYKKMNNGTQAYEYSKKLIVLEPTMQNLLEHADLCIKTKKPDEAEPIFRKYSNQPETRKILIDIYLSKNDYRHALPLLTEQFNKSNDVGLASKIVTCLYATGDTTASIFYLEYITKNIKSEDYSLKLARAYCSQEKYTQALKLYNQIPLQKFSNIDYYNMGICSEVAGDNSRSQTFFETVAKSQDTSFVVLQSKLKIGKIYFDNGKYSEALQYLKELKTESKDMYLIFASCYDGLNNTEQAIIYSLKCLKLDSTNVSATLILAKCYEKKGMATKANTLRKNILNLKADDPIIYYDLGNYYLGINDFAKAIKYFEKSYILSENEMTLQKISYCAFKTDDFDKARDAAESVLKENVKESQSREILYKIYLFRSNYTEAAKNLEMLITVTPKLQYYKDIATCYKNLNDVSKLAAADEKIIALDKSNIPSRERLADYKVSKNPKEALVIYEELVKLKPRDLDVKLIAATIATNVGDVVKSEKYFKEYIAYNPNNADVYILLGNVYFKQNKYSEAKRNYEVALSIQPLSTGFFDNYSKIAISTGVPTSIIPICEKAIRVKEADLDVYRGLGEAYFKIQNYKKALVVFEDAQKMKPEDVSLISKIAYCQMKLGDVNSAIVSYEQVVSMEPKVDEMKLLAGLYLKRENKKEAMNIYKKCLKIKKDEQMAHDVSLYEYEMKNFKEAVVYFQQFDNTSNYLVFFSFIESWFYLSDYKNTASFSEIFLTKYNGTEKTVDVYRFLATSYDKLGDVIKAVKYYKLYASLNTKDADSRYRMACLQEILHVTLAKDMYEENTKSFPNDYRNFFNLGDIYFEKLKDYKNSKIMFQKVVSLNDTCSKALLKLIVVHEELKEYDNEIQVCKKVLVLDPKNFSANKALGVIKAEKGEYSDAILYLSTAQTFDYNDPEISYGLGRAYLASNRFDDAVQYLKMAKNISSNNCSIRKALVEAYLKLNKLPDALKEAEVLVVCQRTNENLNIYVDVLAKNKKHVEAEGVLNEMRKKEPENIEIIMKLAFIQREQGRLDEAVETYKKIAYINSQYALAIVERAEVYLQAGKKDQAKEYYEKALKIDATLAKAEYGLASVYKSVGDTIKYVEHTRKAKELEQKK